MNGKNKNIIAIIVLAVLVEVAILLMATKKGVGAFGTDSIIIKDKSNAVYTSENNSKSMNSTTHILNVSHYTVDDYINESIKIYKKSNDAAAAREIIRTAMETVNNSDILQYYYELYDSAVPKDINEMNMHSSEHYSKCSTVKDAYGNNHMSVNRFKARLFKSDETAYAKYVLNKKMTNFECTFFMDPENIHNEVCFQVVGDGGVIYDSGFLSVDNAPQKVIVNVTDVNMLEIRAYALDGYGYGIPNGYMADTKIYHIIGEEEFY